MYKKFFFDILKALKIFRCPLLSIGGGSIALNAYHKLYILSSLFSISITTTLMGKGVIN